MKISIILAIWHNFLDFPLKILKKNQFFFGFGKPRNASRFSCFSAICIFQLYTDGILKLNDP